MEKLKILKNSRGQMRVIETLLASFIIVAALSFISVFAQSPASPGYEMADLEKTGYSALHDLDQQGLLAPLVYQSKWPDLRIILKMTMPNEVYFNLTIYDSTRTQYYGDSQIFYGDSNTFSDAKNIASVTYCLVGTPKLSSTGLAEASYDPRILVLELTRG